MFTGMANNLFCYLEFKTRFPKVIENLNLMIFKLNLNIFNIYIEVETTHGLVNKLLWNFIYAFLHVLYQKKNVSYQTIMCSFTQI